MTLPVWSRKAVIAGLLAALAVAAPALAREDSEVIDPIELIEAQAVIAIMFPPEKREDMMHDLMSEMSSQFSASLQLNSIEDTGVRSIMEDYLAGLPDALLPLVSEHLPNLLNATAIAYVHRYSLAELRDIRAFAETPSGSHYLSSATALVGDPAVAAANADYLGRVQELNQQLLSGLRQQIVDYLQSHPEAAAAVRSRPS